MRWKEKKSFRRGAEERPRFNPESMDQRPERDIPGRLDQGDGDDDDGGVGKGVLFQTKEMLQREAEEEAEEAAAFISELRE